MASGLSRDDKRRELERGALRHYGRKYAFWIVFGPWLAKAALWVGLIALAWITWVKVPHWLLGSIALGLAAGAAAALIRPVLPRRGLRRRMVARATASARPRPQLGWAYVTLMIAGAGMGWLAL